MSEFEASLGYTCMQWMTWSHLPLILPVISLFPLHGSLTTFMSPSSPFFYIIHWALICCLPEHGCDTIYLSMVNLAAAKLLNKVTFPPSAATTCSLVWAGLPNCTFWRFNEIGWNWMVAHTCNLSTWSVWRLENCLSTGVWDQLDKIGRKLYCN